MNEGPRLLNWGGEESDFSVAILRYKLKYLRNLHRYREVIIDPRLILIN